MEHLLKITIVTLLVLTSLFFVIKNDDNISTRLTYNQNKSTTKYKFYKLYNEYRTEMNLDTLTEDTILVFASLQHSLWLSILNQQNNPKEFMITHWEDTNVGDIDERKTPKDRIDHYDSSIRGFIGENLDGKYNGEFTAEEIFNDWKNSPIHNAILLDSRCERMGLGIIHAEKNGIMCDYVTLLVTN
jgi:hypothetical protein